MEDIILDSNGRKIFLSPRGFRQEVVLNGGCFICAEKITNQTFSAEHIFPDWILREFSMHNNEIDLPNGETHKYSSYRVPCCINCNSRMGSEIERPLRKALTNGYDNLSQYIEENSPLDIYMWLARIFLKMHLRDKILREYLDPRKGTKMIGDKYLWEGFYFSFCLSRAFYAGTGFDPNTLGSFLVLRVADNKNNLSERFFFRTDTNGRVLVLQMRDVGLIAAFNDFGIALNAMDKMIEKIDHRPVNPSQLGELAAHVAIINKIYGNRPELTYLPDSNSFTSVPPEKTIMNEVDKKTSGEIKFEFIKKMISDNDTELANGIRSGERTFLWKEDGTFNDTHLFP